MGLVLRRVTRPVWVRVRAPSSSGRLGTLHVVYMFSAFLMHLRSVAPGRVLFELGGVPIREELAREGTWDHALA